MRSPRSRIILKRVGIGFAVFLMALTLFAVYEYKKLQGNIDTVEFDPDPRPAAVAPKAINILVMGSDTRDGANGKGIGGDTPGLSDTTMILHLSANRKFAYGVSLPRDAMVMRPSCRRKDGNGKDPGGLTMFNTAYAVGGPAYTVKTVERLTGIRMDHFVVVDFVGFKAMVNAIHGVKICVPTEVNDTVGNINLPAGTYTVTGQQALDYVRVRHDIGAPTGDIGRMKRQQSFIAAMIKKVISAGTLTNPIRTLNFLEAATESLTTDPEFANLKQLASLGNSLKNIGLDNVQFITVPFQEYAPDPNRVEWSSDATALWSLIKRDKNIGARFNDGAVSPGSGTTPSANASSTPSGNASGTPSGNASNTPSSKPTKSQAEKDAEAEAAGLCT
ncbi:LCP family protein [Nocardioides marmoriginsengisoli]|uniref:LCP family protein n=1 Tax=Nocardioides marmoriginsengisoli TaxID=661483 RepID=UPI001607CD77|nr:LCP family protein [Nocardioides marmoriginsengisoli]